MCINPSSCIKYIQINLESADIHPNKQICGTITVNYSAKYDGIVINTQILDSNELINYESCNGKKISQNVARLFIDANLIHNKVEFTATINFVPKQIHDIKFRASIIEQHKEIESDVLFAKFSS